MINEQPHQRTGPRNSTLAQYWFFSPGLSYITAVLGISTTTMPMTGHRSCWSRPGSWDQFLGLGQDSQKPAWWSALLADPGCHLLVCIAWVVGSNAGCATTLSSWLPKNLKSSQTSLLPCMDNWNIHPLQAIRKVWVTLANWRWFPAHANSSLGTAGLCSTWFQHEKHTCFSSTVHLPSPTVKQWSCLHNDKFLCY